MDEKCREVIENVEEKKKNWKASATVNRKEHFLLMRDIQKGMDF
jgi:hypothetical protein